MKGFLLAFCSPGVLLIGAAIFVILVTVILTTLRRAGIFPPGATLTLAICASLLAVIGIIRTFGTAGQTREGSAATSWLDFMLLPYTAMGISMLLVLLLLLLGRATAGARERHRRSGRSFCDEYQKNRRTEDDPERPETISGREDGRLTD